jgi:hypothetical protein
MISTTMMMTTNQALTAISSGYWMTTMATTMIITTNKALTTAASYR